MKEDFSELITYLDEKFSNIDEKFLNIDEKFIKIEGILETKADKIDVQNLMTAVDRYAEKADAYFQEMIGNKTPILSLY